MAGARLPDPRLHRAEQRFGHSGVPAGQGPQHFHHEQRVPPRPLQDRPGQRVLPGLAGELLDRGRAERAHLDPGGHRAERGAELRIMLSPDGHQHQQPGAGGVAAQVVDELGGRLARVLQVIHDEQDRSAFGQAGQERGRRLERPAPFHVRAAPPGRGGPEQRGHFGQQGGGRLLVLAEQLPQRAPRHPGHDRRHRFHDGLQEERALGLIAARAQHGRAGHGRLARDLLGEGRLTDPRLADDHHHAPIPGHGAGPGLAQGRGLRCPPRQGVAGTAGPGDVDGVKRLNERFELEPG